MDRKAKLSWTEAAVESLDAIAEWIALDDPAAASRLVERVLARVERLASFPASGRRVPELAGSLHREVAVPPCRVVYRRDGRAVVIVFVFRQEMDVGSRLP